MSPTSTDANATKVVTGKVRLSYFHGWEPFANDGKPENAKYSTVLLIPKADTKTMDEIRRAEKQALLNGKEKKFGGRIPKDWKSIIHDGDDEDEEIDYDKNPEYKGCYYMSVSSKTRPGIVDRQRQPIEDSSEVYSGCYARVSINAFAYNTQGNKGVSFGLNHIQKWADGDYLGGRTRAEDDFDDLDDDDLDDDDLL